MNLGTNVEVLLYIAQYLSVMVPEMIIEVLKSMDSLATVTSFSNVSRVFRAVWLHSHWICYGILSGTITCYQQVFEYVEAQPPAVIDPEHCAIAQPPADIDLEHIEDATLVLFKVIRKFFDNADIAYRSWWFYEDLVSEYVSDENWMTRNASDKDFRPRRL